jgi:hypothetical protein
MMPLSLLRAFQCAAAAALLGGCNHLVVTETVLPTNQRVAQVSGYGDGVSPPAHVMFVEDRPGHFVPVSTEFGTAVVPTVLAGAGAAVKAGALAY